MGEYTPPKNLPRPEDVVEDPAYYYVLQEQYYNDPNVWYDEAVYKTYADFYKVATDPQYSYDHFMCDWSNVLLSRLN